MNLDSPNKVDFILLENARKPTNISNGVEIYDNTASLNSDLTIRQGVGQIGKKIYASDDSGSITSIGSDILGSTVCFIGDSISMFNRNTESGATLPIANSNGWFSYFNILRGGAHHVQVLAASGAQATTGATTQLTALKALAIKPKECFVCFGANDFYGATMKSSSSVLATMDFILKELAALGIRAWVLDGFYKEPTGAGTWTIARYQGQMAYINALPALLEKYKNHKLLDIYSLASGQTGLTYDGLHPNVKYARLISNWLDKVLPDSSSIISPTMANNVDMRGQADVYSHNVSTKSTLSGVNVGDGSAQLVAIGFNQGNAINCSAVLLVTGTATDKKVRITLTATGAANYRLDLAETGNLATIFGASSNWISSLKYSIIDNGGVLSSVYNRGACVGGGTDQFAFGGYIQSETATAPGVIPVMDAVNDELVVTAIGAPNANMTGIVNSVGITTKAAGVVVVEFYVPAMFKIPTIL